MGAIATPHAMATEAGAQAYRDGGNAIDAALAAAAVLTVVYPHQCALGGDLFAVVGSGSAESKSINGSGASAAALDVQDIRSRFTAMPDSGPVPITVPGLVGGWQAIHSLGARLPWVHLLTPAIRAAREGIPVSRSLENGLQKRQELLLRDPGLRARFFVGGTALRQGDVLRQPELAATLQRLAETGLRDFYTGEVASQLIEGLHALGSPLAAADFASHRTETTRALRLELGELAFETSPPNSQGFVLLEALAAVGTWVLRRDGDPSRVLRALLIAIEDREKYLGDPLRSPVPLDRLLDPNALQQRLAPRQMASLPQQSPPAHGDTVAVCSLDEDGVGVSLIQSVFQLFGSGILEPRTGIICHNRGRGFSLNPGAPNALAPLTRPAHTLMPLLVRRGPRLEAVMGTMGGRAQPQILAQLLGGVLDRQTPLVTTLRAPRWVAGSLDIDFQEPTIAVESDAPASFAEALQAPGFAQQRIAPLSEIVGHAQVIRVTGAAQLEAASDPRSDGAAVVTEVGIENS
jgi:gamma-glutamyltranspeptidase/glutathione hydrolase